MSDGIVGMGTRALFVLSTNDHVERVHPALVRPGGQPDLAELYEGSALAPHITHVAEAAVAGVYL